MKQKIFEALKQEYSSLGLGDNVLSAQAETLANLGFVNDENLDAVVKAQATGLKAVQAANDKRVADALAKENAKVAKDKDAATQQQTELQKKIDELTALYEADKSTLAEQSEKLKAAQEVQKQLDELKAQTKKQNADYAKKQAELIAFITGKPQEGQQPQPPQPKDPQPENPKPTEKNQPSFDEAAFRKALDKEISKKFEAFTNTNGTQIQEMLAANKALAEQVQALVKENTDYKAAQAAQNRRNFILNKAKELGVPDWRINEGFALAPDASEETITNTLTTVANNIRANVLPQGGVSVPSNGGTDNTVNIDKIAEALVQNL